MKLLLVQPPLYKNLGLQAFILPEPLGLESVAASLLPEHEVYILDMRLEPSLRKTLASIKPDAVGVSASFTPDVYNACRVLEVAKDFNPRIYTFVGGHHATLNDADFFGHADAVVLGEGELTTPELLRFWEEGRALDEVEGIAFQKGDQWVRTKPRPLIENLDETPLPARELTAKYWEHYFHGDRHPVAYVETARGCPFHCKFCSVWEFYRGSYRARSPERVVQELKQIEAPHIFFTDDNFLANVSRVEKIYEAIRKAAINKYYMMQIRADSIVKYKNILAKWASVGLQSVFVGFESITQRWLDELGKRLSVSQIEEAIETLRELGLSAMSSFIINPDFELQDFIDLKRFVKRMKLPMPVFSVLTPLPGTVLYRERAQELTTKNYELFDVIHAVLPTRLELSRFYKEYTSLVKSSYLPYFSPRNFIKRLCTGSLGSFFKQFWTGIKLLRESSPRAMVKQHKLPPGKLSEAKFPWGS